MPRPVLRTELCDRLGIEYPVISAGMGPVAGTGDPVATADLAAAVSEAGGLGVMGAVAYSPDRLREEIRKVRSLTDKPFGVNFRADQEDIEARIDLAIAQKVKVASFAQAPREKVIKKLKTSS